MYYLTGGIGRVRVQTTGSRHFPTIINDMSTIEKHAQN